MSELWKHQSEAIHKAVPTSELGLFFEQGTGKTRTCIEILRRKFSKEGRVMRTLIVCPLIVCRNWKDEFAKYSKISPDKITILTGEGKKRVKVLEKLLDRDSIIITNFEGVQVKDIPELLAQWGIEVLVVDESQRVKNPQSKRAKVIEHLSKGTTYRYILSGTPILNSPMDLFMQFKILDLGKTFGSNFFTFRAMYFEDKNAGMRGKHNYFPKWEPRANIFAEFNKLIKHRSVRVLKSECLDLPPMVRQKVYVGLSPAQRKLYEEMKKEYVTFIANEKGTPKAVVAQLAITKSLRMQQILSGFAKDDEGTIHNLECPRLAALEEILEDLTPNHKVIVWAVFKENYKDIAAICQKLNIKFAELHGEIKDKNTEIDKFRLEEDCRVMIANQGAGGVGINLIEANYSVYYSKGFSLEHDLQSEARNYRGGSEMHSKVTRIDLIAEGTLDELINDSLANKQKISEVILEWKI